ncbi:gag-pol polyprotein [Cucumis melo var. makuwa]|uniref:Gag-pol polyprotein n=1 Tax=Cucumis melo var. makuwa TaxID=1194695 RepID=A0A5A7T2I7_CUCMM|nr:gag-pol polyprotein [Cucumis melo var. makuwa]TYK03092.1 gag-pol polyprotein [Cucumis melo var. makuwa]
MDGYESPMITVDGVLVPKPEVDWIDAEEQASVGISRALNAIFNGVDLNVFKVINSCSTAKDAWRILEVSYKGTSKVKISRLQLITSKFKALKMSEDESVSEYNERVLQIDNESLLLGERIPDSKIVRKVLRSLPRKFDIKVTAIEEAHDKTTLKLDELFGSLLTFEMTISDRENKKGKGISFKSIYEEETIVNQSDNEANMDESIALLMKQFSKVVKKLKNMNTIGSNAQNPNQYRRKDDIDFGDESECLEENCDEELTFEELKVLNKEDSEARAIQKERIQDLMEENERLMSIISSLKLKLKEVQNDYGQTIKSVKMLSLRTRNLDSTLNSG